MSSRYRRARVRGLGGVLVGLGLLACGAEPSPRLLLLITVDTLRADALAAYGGALGLTPHLDALADESLVFERAYAPTPFTLPSLAALHTGRHPTELGLQTNLSLLPDGTPTLADALATRGWKTAGVVSNVVLRERSDLAHGFEVYDDRMPQSEAVRRWPERIAADTTDAAIQVVDAWLDSAGGDRSPLFLWVHYQDPHGPYTPPAGWRERFEGAEARRLGALELPVDRSSFGAGGIPGYQLLDDERRAAFYRAGYDAEIAYMDQELGRLLDGLRERGLYDEAWIAFAADHGEAMGEHGFWFAHGHHLTDELVRVPLLLRLPDEPPGRRDDVASLLDLRPTLLARIADEPAPVQRQGRDLLAPAAAERDSVPLLTTLLAHPVQRQGIVADGYKLILSHENGLWSSALYPLGDEAVDLAAPAPQVAARLRQRLMALRDALDAGVPERARSLTEPQRRELEALGYLREPDG